MRPDPEDVKVTCPLPKGHDSRRRPCAWMKTNRPPLRRESTIVDLSPDRTINEVTPTVLGIPHSTPRRGELSSGRSIVQAVSDARARQVELRILEVEGELAALRKTVAVRRSTLDPRELFIKEFVARHPNVTGRALAIALDNYELRPLPSYTKATGLRLWRELWDCDTHPKTQRAVRKFIYDKAELSPRVTGGARKGAKTQRNLTAV